MSIKIFIKDILDSENKLLSDAIEPLSNSELYWQPSSDTNSIVWLTWHMFRVEDMWIHFFAQKQPELWEQQCWNVEFNLPVRETGFQQTPEQLATFPKLDITRLLAYGHAVRQDTRKYLDTINGNDFSNTPWSDRSDMWWHDFSIEAMFRQIIGEVFQHLGQIAYLRGLQRGFGDVRENFGTPRNI